MTTTIPFDGTTAVSLTASDHSRFDQWNRTEVEFDCGKLIHNLFDEQALRTPEKIAIICRDRVLTYAGLREKVHRLARHLRKLGIGPETVVAIFMERSIDMVAAMLGVLEAGGAYLPLDPEFPPERVGFMLEDSDTRVILTHQRLKNRLENSQAIVVSLDETDIDHHATDSAVSASSNPAAYSLAYLMYTSGSTGTPKGVMVEHRNVLNFFAGMDGVVGIEAGVWLAVTSISFDISVLELLWTLCRGFTVVMQTSRNGLAATGEYSIQSQIARHRVTHFQCTPTLARALIRFPETLSAMRLLKKLFIGGEALPLSLANQLGEELSAEIFNMYGPTETTVWSTTYKLKKSGASIPIGKPIANTRIYILDEHGIRGPIGAAGELYIGGAGVARGYWRRPELTAEKFVVNSFEHEGRGILYRTGDLARYRDDGEIEFIGRTDQQIKIRGFRIELGEIETVLGAHPAVHEAVVVSYRDPASQQQLAAHVVLKHGLVITEQELKIHARKKLPEYMIPPSIRFLDALPLTPNGKIDRKALPAPGSNGTGESTNDGHASTELERVIAELWQDALGVDTVGLQVNLFDLGANSLSVAEVATSLRQRLKREIPLIDFFTYPTIAALAAHLSGANGRNENSMDQRDRGGARRQALLRRSRATTHPASNQTE
jgi:amino acid adenylation domain-containing protein